MAITLLAMWFQDSEMANSLHTMSTFMGVLAISVALLVLMIVVGGAVVAMQVLKAVKKVTTIANDLQTKANPIIQEAGAISKHVREVIEDAKPKIAVITENLAKTSHTVSETAVSAKGTVEKLQQTVVDANVRTQRQVARVDGMVSAALNTTAEVVESINHGIRVPAQKIAQAANQAKVVAEGLVERIKGMAGSMPFGGQRHTRKPSTYSASSSAATGSTYRSSTTVSGSGSCDTDSPSTPTGTSYAAAPRIP